MVGQAAWRLAKDAGQAGGEHSLAATSALPAMRPAVARRSSGPRLRYRLRCGGCGPGAPCLHIERRSPVGRRSSSPMKRSRTPADASSATSSASTRSISASRAATSAGARRQFSALNAYTCRRAVCVCVCRVGGGEWGLQGGWRPADRPQQTKSGSSSAGMPQHQRPVHRRVLVSASGCSIGVLPEAGWPEGRARDGTEGARRQHGCRATGAEAPGQADRCPGTAGKPAGVHAEI